MVSIDLNTFVQRVAEELKIIAIGQELRPRDRATIEAKLDDTLAELRRLHYVDYDRNEIPDYAVLQLTRLVAGVSAEPLNVAQAEKYVQLAQGAIGALRALEYEVDKAFRRPAEVYF